MWSRPELFYCSNVHKSESLSEVESVIDHHIPAVKDLRSLQSMNSGLWLSNRAAGELQQDKKSLNRFRKKLEQNSIQLFSLNGFPYGDFHLTSVKQKVYQPDWSDRRRLNYTLALANILAACLPQPQQTGTISTLPLGARFGWSDDRHEDALRLLCEAVTELVRLQEQTGQTIRLCLEMEPGCVLERTEQTLQLFQNELPEAAQQAGLDPESITHHLGVCFDVCHQAVMFENPYESLQRLHQAGIIIGKIQLSSALEVAHPDSRNAHSALSGFQEPRYLHQVYTRTGTGQVHGVMDLPEALEGNDLSRHTPWRIHFHLPLQVGTLEQEELGTTQFAIGQTLDFLADTPGLQPHLEVETYTWQVLPETLRPGNDEQLHAGLAAELHWVEQQMQRRGLLVQS